MPKGLKTRRLLLLAAQKQTEVDQDKAKAEAKEAEEIPVTPEDIQKKKEEDERRKYSIRKEVLMKIKHDEAPRKRPRKHLLTFSVKKVKPKEKTVVVHVLKPADPDSPLKPRENIKNYAGPQVTKDGQFIEHSILGSLEDFKTEARRKGEYSHLFPPPTTTAAEKRKIQDPQLKGSNPLEKWNTTVKEWNKTKTYLSDKLQRPVDDLLMRKADVYSSWIKERQEVADALDASLSGYGDNCVLWRQCVQFAEDDQVPMILTMKHRERGDARNEEFVEIPNLIKSEKGQGKINLENSYKPYYTNYLQEQRDNLKDVIHIINPYHPDLADLMIQGQSSRKAEVPPTEKVAYQGHITVYKPITIIEEPEPQCVSKISESKDHIIQGPALGIGKQVLALHNTTGKNPIRPLTLFFNTKPGQKQMEKISLMNYGSTAIRYNWEKIIKKNSFGLVKPKVQQFYFDTEYGVLPPGEEEEIPVLFKSNFSGTFKETWKLKTGPILCGGTDIVVTFVGSTLQDVSFHDELDKLKERFSNTDKQTVSNFALNEIFVRVGTPPRPRSPISTYQTTGEIFNQAHPGLIYHSSKLKLLEELYDEVCNSGLIEPKPEHSFTVPNLRKIIGMFDSLDLPSVDSENYQEILIERFYKQQEFTEQYCTLISDMSFPHQQPSCNVHLRRLHICCQIFHGMVEDFTTSAFTMAYRVNIPVKSLEKTDKKKKKSPVLTSVTKPKTGGRNNDQKSTLAPPKGRLSKTPLTKRAQSPILPPSPPPSPPKLESFSPVIKVKASEEQLEAYREKLYIQVYSLLQSAVDRMDYIFSSFDTEQPTYPS